MVRHFMVLEMQVFRSRFGSQGTSSSSPFVALVAMPVSSLAAATRAFVSVLEHARRREISTCMPVAYRNRMRQASLQALD